MSIGVIISLMRGAVTEVISLVAPVLGLALIVGLVVAIFQATTSIQEQTLTFLPKLIVILLVIALLGGAMFTSRAEYRILLRQDNADYRLTSRSHDIGLADEFRYSYMMSKYDKIGELVELSDNTNITKVQANSYLSSIGEDELRDSKKISEVVSRPSVKLASILQNVPRGTKFIESLSAASVNAIPDFDFPLTYSDTLESTENSAKAIKNALSILSFNQNLPITEDMISSYWNTVRDSFIDEVVSDAEILIKYRGYIEREKALADKIVHLESLRIPDSFDFDSVSGLSIECRQKLKKYHPETIGQASRISGISPADISIILVHFGR